MINLKKKIVEGKLTIEIHERRSTISRDFIGYGVIVRRKKTMIYHTNNFYKNDIPVKLNTFSDAHNFAILLKHFYSGDSS